MILMEIKNIMMSMSNHLLALLNLDTHSNMPTTDILLLKEKCKKVMHGCNPVDFVRIVLWYGERDQKLVKEVKIISKCFFLEENKRFIPNYYYYYYYYYYFREF